MQEPHVEDVANHNDPELCGVCREVHVEALKGGNAGQPLSLRQFSYGEPTVLSFTGRHYWQSLHRDGNCLPCEVTDPGMRGNF